MRDAVSKCSGSRSDIFFEDLGISPCLEIGTPFLSVLEVEIIFSYILVIFCRALFMSVVTRTVLNGGVFWLKPSGMC